MLSEFPKAFLFIHNMFTSIFKKLLTFFEIDVKFIS